MSGEKYADTLEEKAKKSDVTIKLNYTLVKIDDDVLTFSTPDGIVRYQAKRVLFALGARESTRASRLVSGGRSPNIITTGTLQRFTYIQGTKPFKKAVIIGSEIVSFSAIMTAKHAGIDIVGVIESRDKIESFPLLKNISKYILKAPVYTSSKLVLITTEDKEVKSVTISTNGKLSDIECDGVIFTGDFIPESAILQKSCKGFNQHNHSLSITQNFQIDNERFFLAGNVVRGALTAFNCYFEGRDAGAKIAESLNEDKAPTVATITVGQEMDCWYYPSLIDVDSPIDFLTKVRFRHRTEGILSLFKNGELVSEQEIDAVPYKSITVSYYGDILKDDRFELDFEPIE